ncbi:hypothetical protein B0T22DRAFT_198453 [Podospora appendiculata]|uniref:Uncharacterized protein n=1 Tax=Podospora appendiculata TaxID=314037 RepID=A0AAE0X4B8_9PEZI|nr:hypothetical protein B0T22DRAFT_198453 [Podospora appendiculata]
MVRSRREGSLGTSVKQGIQTQQHQTARSSSQTRLTRYVKQMDIASWGALQRDHSHPGQQGLHPSHRGKSPYQKELPVLLRPAHPCHDALVRNAMEKKPDIVHPRFSAALSQQLQIFVSWSERKPVATAINMCLDSSIFFPDKKKRKDKKNKKPETTAENQHSSKQRRQKHKYLYAHPSGNGNGANSNSQPSTTDSSLRYSGDDAEEKV